MCCDSSLHLYVVFQRGEAKLLTEDWEGAVEDLKSAAQKSPQVSHNIECSLRCVLILLYALARPLQALLI